MKSVYSNFLSAYGERGIVIRLKVRFLLNLLIGMIILMVFVIVYTALLHLRNPIYNYSINYTILIPEILVLPVLFVALYLLKTGRFSMAGHPVMILAMALFWLVMFSDRAAIVSRLDTISIMLAVMAMTPLVVERRKLVILVYAAVNLAVLYVFAFYFRADWDLPVNSFVDYLLDNTVALIVITIVAYNMFSINQKSLDRMEEELADRARAEEELRASNSVLNSLMENSSDYILVSDENALPVAFNRAYGELFSSMLGFKMRPGIQPHKHIGDPEITAYWDGLHRRVLSGETFRETVTHVFPDGVKRYINVSFNPIERDGLVTGFTEISRDITDIMEAEEQLKTALVEKETLLRELHHRTRNNMQVISSFIALQESYQDDDRFSEIFRGINLRIQSIAMVHQKLYSSRSLSRINIQEYIRDLIGLVMEGYGAAGNGITPVADIANETVSIDVAVPCGLVLNELLTNSLKYAFPGNFGGTIHVTFRKDNDSRYRIDYRDSGIGLPPGTSVMDIRKLGISIIINIVTHQLRGTIDFFGDDGFACAIEFDPENFRDRI